MKQEVIIVGAGGHAKVCIELLQSMGEEVIYCIGTEDSPDHCLDIPVLKGNHHLSHLREKGYFRIFIAVGLNKLREQLATLAINLEYKLVNAISPEAVISPSASLGMGIAVMAGVVINAKAVIADLAIINTGATIDHDCQIGKTVHIAPQCALAGNVKVGNKSFLGVGCKIIPGIEIRENVTVGAGSVVISNIEYGATVVGVPARIIHQSIEKECYAANICCSA